MNAAATVLPPDAVRMLQQAATTPGDLERRIAVETATQRVQQMYPNHFRKDHAHETQAQ